MLTPGWLVSVWGLLGALLGLLAVLAWIGERGGKPLESSRRFYAEFRSRRQPFLEWLHGYAYGRWMHPYVNLARRVFPFIKRVDQTLAHFGLRHGLRHLIANTAHGKVVRLEEATRLVTVNEDITLTGLERVVPFTRARDIILRNPDHIVVLDCPCRRTRANPCLPLDVCLVIGEPFASFVLEHQVGHARRIMPKEAVEILRAEDERGHVHHAFFKEAMLDRFYAICNCCACCCGPMEFWQHDTPMLVSSGYIAQVDGALCVGCGVCARFCQFGALSLVEEIATVDREKCMGCGICESKCPQGAISLQADPTKAAPLRVGELMVQAQQYALEERNGDV